MCNILLRCFIVLIIILLILLILYILILFIIYYYCRDMDEWKLYIDAHIHSIYIRESGITSDYWNEGGIGLRIFQLPPDYDDDKKKKSSKLLRPVGIRSLPIIDGNTRQCLDNLA